MHGIENYLRRLSTEQLSTIIREDCEGPAQYSPEVIMKVCEILAERNPVIQSAEEMFQEFLHYYAVEYGVEDEDL